MPDKSLTPDRGDGTRLDEVVLGLLRRWRLVLLVAVPVLLGVVGYASSLPTTWTASATVSLSPRAGSSVGADTVTLLVPGYVAFLTSPAVEQLVGGPYDVTATDLDRTVDVSVPPTTATITVTATESTPQLAADLANGLADRAVVHAVVDPILTADVVSRAAVPVTPSGPRRRLLEIFGLLAALLLGALVAGIVERGFPRVRSSADVRSEVGQDVLGLLPRSGALRSLGGEAIDEAVVGVAVRTLRLQLELASHRLPGAPLVLAVCSADRGEGRSAVTALLAHAYARLDARVLLVDGDVARCHLTAEYALDVPAGGLAGLDLVGLLEERAGLGQVVRSTGVPNLDLLPCSPVEGASDLLARRMGPLLHQLRQAGALAPVTGGSSGALLEVGKLNRSLGFEPAADCCTRGRREPPDAGCERATFLAEHTAGPM